MVQQRICETVLGFRRSPKVVGSVLAGLLLLACSTFADPISADAAEEKRVTASAAGTQASTSSAEDSTKPAATPAQGQSEPAKTDAIPVPAQSAPDTSPAPAGPGISKPTETTDAAPKSPSPEECLDKIKMMEPRLPSLIEAAKTVIKGIIPDPQDYEKKLPPFDQVVATKDLKNLRNYGGLAEAYLYGGDEANGDRLFAKFKSVRDLLPADDTFPGGVYGDFGFMYFSQKKYSEAEPLLLESTRLYETYPTQATNNGLVTDYLCLALIKDQAGDKTAAGAYAKKLIDLAIKEHQRTAK